MFAQYNRLGVSVYASPREVLKASQRMLSAKGKTHAFRASRHAFYRQMLAHHCAARALTKAFQL